MAIVRHSARRPASRPLSESSKTIDAVADLESFLHPLSWEGPVGGCDNHPGLRRQPREQFDGAGNGGNILYLFLLLSDQCCDFTVDVGAGRC